MGGSAAVALPLRQSLISDDCAIEIERYCPMLSGTEETRNQRICLKPYHASLSRRCRRTLAVAKH